MYKEEIATYIRENCVHRPSNAPYMLGKLPGTRYASQFYMANLTTNSEMMEKVYFEFEAIMNPPEKFGLVAPEWSGIPIMSHLAANLYRSWDNIPCLIVRNERKTYGRHNYIEGIPVEGIPYIIVNDIANSGKGYRHCHDVLTSHGLQVHHEVFAVLNKYSPDQENFEYDRYLGNGHEIVSICNRKDIFGT